MLYTRTHSLYIIDDFMYPHIKLSRLSVDAVYIYVDEIV